MFYTYETRQLYMRNNWRWQVFYHQKGHRWSVASGTAFDRAAAERAAFNECIRRCYPRFPRSEPT